MNELTAQLRATALALQARFDMPREPHRGLASITLLTAAARLSVAAGLLEAGVWSASDCLLLLTLVKREFA